MILDALDPEAKTSFDRELWAELCTLRFLEDRLGSKTRIPQLNRLIRVRLRNR